MGEMSICAPELELISCMDKSLSLVASGVESHFFFLS